MMEMVSMCVELSRYLTQCVSKIQNSVVWNSEKKTKIVTQFNVTVFLKMIPRHDTQHEKGMTLIRQENNNLSTNLK